MKGLKGKRRDFYEGKLGSLDCNHDIAVIPLVVDEMDGRDLRQIIIEWLRRLYLTKKSRHQFSKITSTYIVVCPTNLVGYVTPRDLISKDSPQE